MREYPDKPWCLISLIRNENFTIDLIDELPYLNWLYYILTDKITNLDYLKKYPNKNWNLKTLSNKFNAFDLQYIIRNKTYFICFK